MPIESELSADGQSLIVRIWHERPRIRLEEEFTDAYAALAFGRRFDLLMRATWPWLMRPRVEGEA